MELGVSKCCRDGGKHTNQYTADGLHKLKKVENVKWFLKKWPMVYLLGLISFHKFFSGMLRQIHALDGWSVSITSFFMPTFLPGPVEYCKNGNFQVVQQTTEFYRKTIQILA